jgi:imidazolonepropionase-like amidohydrolase
VLDDQNNAFAALQGWSGLIRAGFEGTFETLYNTQDEVQSARAAGLAKQLIHHPTGDLIFKNVTVFDSATAKNVPTQRVTVRGEKIVSVEAESGQATPAGAQVIDGTGKVLLPGLWDMDQHLYPDNAFLDVAAGITTARDLANQIDELGRLNKHIKNGEQLGPRIIMAGFIDGPGPL